jgi:aspartyl-tRNA(Asn)/glutamyl-tRNA(Gln) amidotransferase subunit C
LLTVNISALALTTLLHHFYQPTITKILYYNFKTYICAMEISIETIDKLSNLAQLQFNETEKLSLKTDLEKMIGFINQLDNVDTTGIEPLQHISDAVNVLRDDELKGSLSKQEALLNAPSKDEQFFKVPKVIKK